MKKMLKIATIGGGSTYTPEIIEGFINRHKKLPIGEIWLVDIAEGEEKQKIVGALAQRMVEKAGINCKVHLTLDRRAALKDADFVTTQFRVGLLEARINDERIPLSFGMMGQETNGVGGFAKALRTIPVILDIAKDMEELCPNAWLINFTNPSGMVTEAVLKNTKIKCIGLCNVPVGMNKAVETILGSNEFLLHCVGLNHYMWGKHIYYKGKDIIAEMLPKLIEHEVSESGLKNIPIIPWSVPFVQKLGMMPVGYHRYYYTTADMLEKQLIEFKEGKLRGEVVKAVEEKLLEKYKDLSLTEKPKELEERGGAHYSDAACDLIKNIYTNGHALMVVNITNNGTIECLPADAVIETTALITDCGAIPLKASALPEPAQTELRLMKTFEQLTIKAAITGDYDTAMQALTLNPLVKKGKITKAVLDEILRVNKPFLYRWKY
jgi:6-phospho-beta-glucosidase